MGFRVGIIGCGNIFPMHSQSVAANPACQLVAVCDCKEDRAKKNAGYYGAKFYTDYKKMIESENLDVVHICTPHYLHSEMAVYAAKHHVNVITEKPMSITMEQAEAMINAAKENQVMLGVIFQNRYNPGAVLIKQCIEDGTLGDVVCAKMSVTWNRSDEYYSNSDWKGTWEKEGGGVIIDQAIHTLDMMNWFINQPIRYVDSTIANRAHDVIEVEDSAEGIICYENGVLAQFTCINYYSYDAPIEIELVCEKGTAKVVADEATICLNDGTTIKKNRSEQDVFTYADGAKSYWGTSHVKQINNYYHALANGVKPDIAGEDALITQKIVCEIYKGKESMPYARTRKAQI